MRTLILALAVVVAAPSAASAQDPIRRGDRQALYESERNAARGFRAPVLAAPQSTLREVRAARRADAAAALINAGDCAGASALAERAGDRALMAGIARVCGSADAPAVSPARLDQASPLS